MLVAQNSLGPVCPVPLTVRGITVGAGFAATGAGAEALTASKAEIDVRSLTRKIAGTTVAGARTAATYTSAKAAKIYSYASDALKGD